MENVKLEPFLVKLNTLMLAGSLIVLVVIVSMNLRNSIDTNSPVVRQDIMEEVNSINEMKLNRIREDVYNMQVKHDREIALLRQQITEQRSDTNVSVGNVNTNVK